jgi:hypothetical protein
MFLSVVTWVGVLSAALACAFAIASGDVTSVPPVGETLALASASSFTTVAGLSMGRECGRAVRRLRAES